MAELVDPADLIDSADVAEIIGLDNRNGVAVYRRRYPDFPAPVIEKGRCLLWARSTVLAWAKSRDTSGTQRNRER